MGENDVAETDLGMMSDEQLAELAEKADAIRRQRRLDDRAEKGHARALKQQVEVLRPQLEKASDRLTKIITPLLKRRDEINDAIVQIDAGEITAFRLHAPRKRKAKTEPEAEQ
jgi:hypothetical protein